MYAKTATCIRVVFLGVKELVVKKKRERNSVYRYTTVLHSPHLPPPSPNLLHPRLFKEPR